MSDTSGGPGWWQASDGKWYPPEQHPPTTPYTQPSEGAPVQRPRWLWPALGGTAAGALIIGLIIGFAIGDSRNNKTETAAASLAPTTTRSIETSPSRLSTTTATTAPTTTTTPHGTRQSPIPVMQPADVGGGWTMKVNSFNPNADADVAAENQFNKPPPAGSHYALVNVDLTYNGAPGKDSSYWFGQVAVLGTKNVPHMESDVTCVAPNELERTKEVFKGGTLTGNMCFALPEDEQGFVLYAAGDLLQSTKTFFALS